MLRSLQIYSSPPSGAERLGEVGALSGPPELAANTLPVDICPAGIYRHRQPHLTQPLRPRAERSDQWQRP
jgi:hypothetical protein